VRDIVFWTLLVFPDVTSRNYERLFQKRNRREVTLQHGTDLLNYGELNP